MDSRGITMIAAVLFLASMAAAGNVNVTKMIERNSDYSEFNQLLTKTGLASQINSRKTVTVLALKNGNLGSIPSQPVDIQKRILSVHVILDYYDPVKLNKLNKSGTVLTTLFQSSGMAKDQQGFLNAVPKDDGKVVIGSAVKGAPQESRVDGVVAVQPYDISVLYISKPIVAPGVDSASGPASSPKASSSETPKADSPTEAESSSEAPTATESPAADATEADSPAADGGDNTSGAGKLVSGVAFGLIAVLASLTSA